MKNFEQARYNSEIYRVVNRDWNIALNKFNAQSYYMFRDMVRTTLGKEVIRLEHGRVSDDWYFMVK